MCTPCNGEDLIDDSLKSLEQEFADYFVRIHRSALVAVDQIDKLEKMPDGKTPSCCAMARNRTTMKTDWLADGIWPMCVVA